MLYCINPSDNEPVFLINKHIGYDPDYLDEKGNLIKGEGQGIDGAIFQQELLQIDGLEKTKIKVYINSFGGSVVDGYSICNAILKTKTPVDTYCVGAAASIAGVIFLTGRKRIMSDYSWLMFHNPFGAGDVMLDTIKSGIVKIIEQRSGMTEAEASKMMDRESFILPDEAIKLKLCDVVETSANENTKYLRTQTNTKDFHRQCNLVLNSYLTNNQNSETMIKVTMKLGLNDSAPEDSIVKAIEVIEQRAISAEASLKDVQNKAKAKEEADGDEMDKLKAKAAKAKEDYDKAMQELEDCKNKLDAMEKDKKAAEDKVEDEKAKNMIEGFAKSGRIKNEATEVAEWVSLSKTIGFDKVKARIEALPLNKIAPVITNATPQALKEGELPTSALGLMAKNRLRREGKL